MGSMKSRPASRKGSTVRRRGRRSSAGRVHPVVIYPFRETLHFDDLEELYRLVRRLAGQSELYARPITVMDRKTSDLMSRNAQFQKFRRHVVARCSDILDVWSVDTCQMWYTGLGTAFERGAPQDVYWLIPGDFDYGSAMGREVMGHLHDLPEICAELKQDLCIGEIHTDHNNSKQLIDTYGTFALLYNWFPREAVEIRQVTERPRSEFFAVRHGFLREMLHRRWYAYEQTVVMLLHAVFESRTISRYQVGNISDLATGKDSLSAAMQQVERAERVLKSMWRERNHHIPDWRREYRRLEQQSEQILRTALVIFGNLLG